MLHAIDDHHDVECTDVKRRVARRHVIRAAAPCPDKVAGTNSLAISISAALMSMPTTSPAPVDGEIGGSPACTAADLQHSLPLDVETPILAQREPRWNRIATECNPPMNRE